MINKIKIWGIKSQDDKTFLETEIDILGGVKNITIDETSGQTLIDFDESQISIAEIIKKIEELGFNSEENFDQNEIRQNPEKETIKEQLYFVKGTHCASCEILIEKRLLAIEGIKSVEAKSDKGEVLIEYTGKKPDAAMLNSIFRKNNYVFSDGRFKSDEKNKGDFVSAILTASVIIFGFLYLNKIGLGGLVNVSSSSSLPSFFALGLMAGISSCAALVGGLVLSMSKQWLETYSDKNATTYEKLKPHILFNSGRIISYGVLGAVLGLIGSKLQISFQFTSLLIFAISILMVLMALQMLGVRQFRKFQFTLPKSIVKYIANEENFKGKYMPFLMGAMTFFLPCGFTITAQGLALLSGSPVQGGLIMGMFALGTAPTLMLIGFSAVKFSAKPHIALTFSRVAGFLILFFALFNINSQLNILGISSASDLLRTNSYTSNNPNNANNNDKDLSAVVDGKQVIKMDASSRGYSPNYFKVRAGVPVRWEITDIGTSGCTNAVISNSLFSGSINLTPGQVSVKEFTPEKAGKYKFSCWMGMISGIIEVVDGSGASANSLANTAVASNGNNNDVIPSGAKGCGCGGGSSASCGAK